MREVPCWKIRGRRDDQLGKAQAWFQAGLIFYLLILKGWEEF